MASPLWLTLCALGRVFQSNLPTLTHDGMSWKEFVERLNPDVHTPPPAEHNYYPYSLSEHRVRTRPCPATSSSPGPSSPSDTSPSPVSEAARYSAEIDVALDFLEKAMEPESIRRITPRAALYHPFLREPDAEEDDEYVPHPFGDGVCGALHEIDDADDLCIKVQVEGREGWVTRKVQAGEGIAIGRRPCEYHRGIDFSVGRQY